MGVKIAPSLLAADFGDLAGAAGVCAAAGAECLHFDTMDGRFVPNLSFGWTPIKALRALSQARFEAHLMVEEPERWVEAFAVAGADLITVHVEATRHLQRLLAQIRQCGARVGLALNPATSLSVLDYVLDDIDLLLVMTVNPGFGGQQFIPSSIRKVSEARRLLEGRQIELEVDGGIGIDNARAVVDAGAGVIVAGTSIFGHPSGAAEGIRALRAAC